MPILPFPEWKPDLSSHLASSTAHVQNVVPRADGYGPFKSFAGYSRPLAEGNDEFTKWLLHFDGADAATTITDSNAGGSAHTWTAAGNAQIDTAQKVFGTGSLLCDGTGDWVTTPDHADFTHGSNPFHHHFRIRPATDDNAMSFAGQGDATTTAAASAWYMDRGADNFISAHLSNGSAFTTITGATTEVVTGAFYDIEFGRSGDTLYLFVDGALAATGTFSGAVNDSANALRIGAAGENTTNAWNGWIDEAAGNIGAAGHTAAFNPLTKAFDAPANGTCRGEFYAYNSDGSVTVFAATINKLFRLDNSVLDWIEVSRTASAYSNLPDDFHWQFAPFGNLVIAVQPNVAPQSFTLGSSTNFADLAGSPPQAAYAAVVGPFLVLSGLTSNPLRVQWCDVGDATNWTTGSADSQDFQDGGIVRGVAGGEHGVVFQQSIIRRMTWTRQLPPNSVFDFDKLTEGNGLLAPYSLTKSGGNILFLSNQGWMQMGLTGIPIPIGKEKFDRFFFNDYDADELQLIIGAGDPEGTRVAVMYKSNAGAAGLADKMLIYDFALQRATPVAGQALEFIAALAGPGATLESLDELFPSIDAMPGSLDDFPLSQLPKLAAFNSTHALGFFSGDNQEATLDTAEQALERQQRVRVRAMIPHTDAATCYGAVGTRERMADSVVYSTEQALNAFGRCPANVSTRLARGRLRIPAATAWTFASAMEPDFTAEGYR